MCFVGKQAIFYKTVHFTEATSLCPLVPTLPAAVKQDKNVFTTLPPLISPSCHNVVFKNIFPHGYAIVFFSKLGVHLPHPVDSKNGKAQWDKDRELLTVTVRLVREYDFLTK